MATHPHNMSVRQRVEFALLLVAVLLLVFGTNLQGVALPILGHERGAGMLAIGLFSAGWSAGFVVACLTVGMLLGAVGPRRVFVALALVSATCGATLPFAPHDAVWISLRVVIGFCFGALSALIEGWLVERAGSGLGFSIYMITNLLASLGGTLSLTILDPRRPATLVIGALATALAAAPVLLARPRRPATPAGVTARPHLGALLRASPDAAIGCITAGLVTGAVGGLGPVFGAMSGLDMRGITTSLAANAVGGALASAPFSLLASRAGHRRVLAAAALLGAAICAPVVFASSLFGPVPLGTTTLVVVFGLLGLVQYPLYGLSVAIANASGRPPAQIATEMLLLFGMGTVAGPLAAGQLMRGTANGLFVFVGALLLLLGTVLAVAHTLRRPRTVALTP